MWQCCLFVGYYTLCFCNTISRRPTEHGCIKLLLMVVKIIGCQERIRIVSRRRHGMGSIPKILAPDNIVPTLIWKPTVIKYSTAVSNKFIFETRLEYIIIITRQGPTSPIWYLPPPTHITHIYYIYEHINTHVCAACVRVC